MEGHTCVGQNRLSKTLRRVAPAAISARENLAYRHLNLHPYHALFYGEKLGLDQNEKLNRFGVTHILAVDGFNRKIVGLITIPQKNAIIAHLYAFIRIRPLFLSEGMLKQIRLDHGTEFALIAVVQQQMATLWPRQHRYPILQSISTQYHRVERLWVEVNQRINYPIK